MGYHYITAENGKEAVDLVQTQYEKNLSSSSFDSQTNSMDSFPSLEFKLGISLILMDCAMVSVDRVSSTFIIVRDILTIFLFVLGTCIIPLKT